MNTLVLALLPLWLLLGDSVPNPPTRVALTIEVTGFRSDAGQARIAVYPSEQAFLVDETLATVQPIRNRRARWTLTVPPGTYAVGVHHDVNNNGVMETSRLGLPREPYGFTNGARGRLGPPRWRSAAVQVPDRPTTLAVQVR
jgi:uncharacterized protein (DUF2141 family)